MQEAAAKVACFFKVVHGLCAEEELSYMADVTRSPPPYNEPIQIVDSQSVTVKLLDRELFTFLRSSRPSTSLYALAIKAITFLHTKCFIKTEFTRVHSHLACCV